MDVGDVRGINGDSLLHICYLAARDFGVIVNQVLQKVILVNYIAKPVFCDTFDFHFNRCDMFHRENLLQSSSPPNDL